MRHRKGMDAMNSCRKGMEGDGCRDLPEEENGATGRARVLLTPAGREWKGMDAVTSRRRGIGATGREWML